MVLKLGVRENLIEIFKKSERVFQKKFPNPVIVSCLHNHSTNLINQLFKQYCKFTVINWLNDCEDMKLVVPTHVVLFH